MKLAPAVLLAALGASALAGCNAYPPPPPPGAMAGPAPMDVADRTGQHLSTCIQSRDIRSHRIADERTLYMQVRSDTYRVTMTGACLAGSFSTDPIITREPPGSSLICRPLDLDLAVAHPGSIGPTPCIVDRIEKMTPAEVAAIPRKLRP